jgi:hypothetical protein
MAQTTAAMNGSAFYIGLQTGGTGAFTDISGSSQSIEMPELERFTGDAYTPDSDYGIVTFGKQKPFDLTVNVIYTEQTAEAWHVLEDAYRNKTLVSIKWQPAGSTAGNDAYATNATRIYKMQLPNGDATTADVIVCSFTLKCTSITITV